MHQTLQDKWLPVIGLTPELYTAYVSWRGDLAANSSTEACLQKQPRPLPPLPLPLCLWIHCRPTLATC